MRIGLEIGKIVGKKVLNTEMRKAHYGQQRPEIR